MCQNISFHFRDKGLFTKLKERALKQYSPWSGRFDLITEVGKVIRQGTGKNNSLFYAVASATFPELRMDEVKEKVSFMRSKVADEVIADHKIRCMVSNIHLTNAVSICSSFSLGCIT